MPPPSVFTFYEFTAALISPKPHDNMTESLPAICHWMQAINLLGSAMIRYFNAYKHEHQMGSCSMVFCGCSLFRNLAVEDKRIHARLSAIKENLEKRREIKALLAAATQHLTFCVCVFKLKQNLKQQIFVPFISDESCREKKSVLVLSACFWVGVLKRIIKRGQYCCKRMTSA